MDFAVSNNKIISNQNSISSNTQPSTKAVSISLENNDEVIKKLCQNFNITPEQYQAIIAARPDFLSINDLQKQQNIVTEYKNGILKTPNDSDGGLAWAEQLRADDRQKQISDKLKYNELSSVNEKMSAFSSVLAKNHFIYGEKDKDGNTIDKSDEWGGLGEDGQQAYIDKFSNDLQTYLKKDENLSYLQNLIKAKTDGAIQEELLDALMRNLVAANSEGESISDFMRLDENERLDRIEEYMREYPEAMNESDLAYKNAWDNIISSVKEVRGFGSNVDLCPSDARKYIKYCNLNEDELLFSALSKKQEKGILNPKEKVQYEELKRTFSTDEGKRQIDKAKAANLAKLQQEFDNFGPVDDSNRGIYELLKQTLNSEEATRLRSIPMPEEKTELDKKVVADIEAFNEKIKGHVKGTTSEAGLIAANIELQCKDMTPEKRKEYIATYIKFYNGSASGKLFGIYSKEFPDLLKNQELVGSAALDDNYTPEVLEIKKKTALKASKNKDAYICQGGICALNTHSQLLEQMEGDEFDDSRLINSRYNSKSNDVTVLINTIRANATIRNAEKAVESQNYMNNSEYKTDETLIFTVEYAKNFVSGAQAAVMNGATDKSAAAAAHVAEHNLIEGLHKDAQREAFKGTHQSINKWFDGEDAIKYSKSLADQIQNCDKDNQLDMHNEIMGSKYSEVQEHAAGNIKNYDSSVQQKAMDSVYKSGNQKAIDRAVENMTSYKSDDVKKEELGRVFGEHCAQIAGEKDLNERFLGGKLTLQEISQLPASQRREYYVNLFKKATPAQKLAWLNKMPDGTQKKTVYTFIALYDSNLLSSMIENGKGLEMFNVCSDVAAQNKILALMNRSENHKVKEQYEQIKNNPRNAALFIGKNDTQTSDADLLMSDIEGLKPFIKRDKEKKVIIS